MRLDNTLKWTLTAVGVLAIAVILLACSLLNPTSRQEAYLELLRAGSELLTVAVIGTVVAVVLGAADRRRDVRRRLAEIYASTKRARRSLERHGAVWGDRSQSGTRPIQALVPAAIPSCMGDVGDAELELQALIGELVAEGGDAAMVAHKQLQAMRAYLREVLDDSLPPLTESVTSQGQGTLRPLAAFIQPGGTFTQKFANPYNEAREALP